MLGIAPATCEFHSAEVASLAPKCISGFDILIKNAATQIYKISIEYGMTPPFRGAGGQLDEKKTKGRGAAG